MEHVEIEKQQQEKYTQLFKECGVFWAFSYEQFAENKTPLQEGEKYVSIGGGGYMPKGMVSAYISGMKEIAKWKKAEIKKRKDGMEQHIKYELNNHECWYTGDISDAEAVLPYSRKEILKVYNKYKEEALANL